MLVPLYLFIVIITIIISIHLSLFIRYLLYLFTNELERIHELINSYLFTIHNQKSKLVEQLADNTA